MKHFGVLTKSNNALACEEDGIYNATTWAKAPQLRRIFPGITSAVLIQAVGSGEWHHTGSYANCTRYISVDEIFQALHEIRRMIIEAKSRSKNVAYPILLSGNQTIHFEYWGGSRNHPTLHSGKYLNAKIELVSDQFVKISNGKSSRRMKIGSFTYKSLDFSTPIQIDRMVRQSKSVFL